MPTLTQPRRVYLSPPHMSGKEQMYIQEAFDTNWIAPLGPNVDAFERELAAYVGAAGGAAVSSGTAALHLALRLAGVVPGDRVLCSSLTFAASANPIIYLGAEPVFVDAEPATWNMSPAALERAFAASRRQGCTPKAVIAVHLYGQPALMDDIAALCAEYGAALIEDAAESLGSTYRGQQTGTFGRYGIYSFNGNKIITTSGGGMLVSNRAEDLHTARFLASQARDPALHYQHSQLGYNYRMSNVLAGIGRAQLEVLEQRVAARRTVFERYSTELSDLPGVSFQPEQPGTRSNRWLTVLTLSEQATRVTPQRLIAALDEHNIEARPVWKPLHLQPLYDDCEYFPHEAGRSVGEELFRTGICLPSGSGMTEDEQERVIRCIRGVFAAAGELAVNASFYSHGA